MKNKVGMMLCAMRLLFLCGACAIHCTASAAGGFYDWRNVWMEGAPVGSDLAFGGDLDGDGMKNGEEYAMLSDPMVAGKSSFHGTFTAGSNAVLGLEWNSAAPDISWYLRSADRLAEPAETWPLATNATVSRTPDGDLSSIQVNLNEPNGTNRFFALQIRRDEPGTVLDLFDDDGRWNLIGNAAFSTGSGSVAPTSGFEFLRHYKSGAWNHSAAVRDAGIPVAAGSYVITVDVGHDGTALPFATGYVNIGFLEDPAGIASASGVRDAITLFDTIAGVSRTVVSNAVPNAGWKTWQIRIDIAADSVAIGRTAYVGIHAQSGSSGNQALFDHVRVESFPAEDEGWTLFNNAKSLSESGWLVPVEGTRFLNHTVGANWSHSAMVKDSGLTIEPGTYVMALDAGYDANSSRPFATDDCVRFGFIDAATNYATAVEVRDAITAFKALAGVAATEERTPVVANGWVPWRQELDVAAGSAAVGKGVLFGIHAQSKTTVNQASFDHVRIIGPVAHEVVVSADQDVAWIDPKMFGANLVYHAEKLDSSYIKAFNDCGMELLRYPGGSICEQEFDYLDSDGPDNDRPSLYDVVGFCNSNNTELILVVPTKRFKDDIPAGVQYAKAFVKAVNIDHMFGNIHVKYWELGNEYYANPTDALAITADEYKVIADQFAAGMVQTDPTIVPVVQFRRTELVEAQTISDYLTASTNNGSVRASLTHAYPGEDLVNIRDALPVQFSQGKQIYGFDDLLVTEWNIGSGAGVKGMKLANYVLLLFESLAKGGVTKTTMWPLNWQINGVSTVWSDVNTGALRPAGQAFAELAPLAKESTLVQTTVGSDAFHVSAYRRGSQELALFVTSFALPVPTLLKIHVDGFPFSRVEAHRLGKEDELSNGAGTWEDAHVVQDGQDLYVEANKFNDWEIVRLTLYP
ncbi:MAG: hypothetical protein K9M54_12930 [Kiritimatiellales bacterium]|nr:hypothetical protein [Kiritimatiellales bacterium]